MRLLILAILLSSCAQSTPVPYAHDPIIMDAGAVVPVTHRLKLGAYVTSDGLIGPAPFEQSFYDTAFNSTCFPADDSAGQTRCFPNVGYAPRAYKNGCTEEVFVSHLNAEGELHGSYKQAGVGSGFRINKVGAMTNAGTYFQLPGCVAENTSIDEMIYAVGEDITPTLETLTIQYRDSP